MTIGSSAQQAHLRRPWPSSMGPSTGRCQIYCTSVINEFLSHISSLRSFSSVVLGDILGCIIMCFWRFMHLFPSLFYNNYWLYTTVASFPSLLNSASLWTHASMSRHPASPPPLSKWSQRPGLRDSYTHESLLTRLERFDPLFYANTPTFHLFCVISHLD